MNLSLLSPTLPTRRPRNLAMRVVDTLADRIRDGSLACGDKLATESALMTEFGVSRTVIREALSKLQEQKFDLVFMDVHMPNMGGFEATAEIRRREKAHGLPRIPIVALRALLLRSFHVPDDGQPVPERRHAHVAVVAHSGDTARGIEDRRELFGIHFISSVEINLRQAEQSTNIGIHGRGNLGQGSP